MDKVVEKGTKKDLSFDTFFNPDAGPVSLLELGEKIMPGDIVQGQQYKKYWLAGLLLPLTEQNVLSQARRGSIGARYLMRKNPGMFSKEQIEDVKDGMKAKFKDYTLDKWLEFMRNPSLPQLKELTKTDWVMLARFMNVHINNETTIDDIYAAIVSKYDKIINPTTQTKLL